MALPQNVYLRGTHRTVDNGRSDRNKFVSILRISYNQSQFLWPALRMIVR